MNTALRLYDPVTRVITRISECCYLGQVLDEVLDVAMTRPRWLDGSMIARDRGVHKSREVSAVAARLVGDVPIRPGVWDCKSLRYGLWETGAW